GGPLTQVFFRLPYFRGGSTPQPPWPQSRVLAPDVGTFQIGVNLGAGSGGYGGNLEITHPTPDHPLGQIIQGNIRSSELAMFLTSQEVQTPFQIPTSWLAVGHVDEYVLFTQEFNKVVVADPTLAYQLMNQIPAKDRGKAVFFARGHDPETYSA